jgi:hypothetical protein
MIKLSSARFFLQPIKTLYSISTMFCVEDFGVRVHKIVLVIYIMYCNYCVVSTKQTLEKTEGAVIYVQSRNTGNIGNTRHRTETNKTK